MNFPLTFLLLKIASKLHVISLIDTQSVNYKV